MTQLTCVACGQDIEIKEVEESAVTCFNCYQSNHNPDHPCNIHIAVGINQGWMSVIISLLAISVVFYGIYNQFFVAEYFSIYFALLCFVLSIIPIETIHFTEGYWRKHLLKVQNVHQGKYEIQYRLFPAIEIASAVWGFISGMIIGFWAAAQLIDQPESLINILFYLCLSICIGILTILFGSKLVEHFLFDLGKLLSKINPFYFK
jgi:hypothetical protein